MHEEIDEMLLHGGANYEVDLQTKWGNVQHHFSDTCSGPLAVFWFGTETVNILLCSEASLKSLFLHLLGDRQKDTYMTPNTHSYWLVNTQLQKGIVN